MKKITAEMLVAKAKENGKELTIEQAEGMIRKAASLNDDELTTISGGGPINKIIAIYDDAMEVHSDCPNTSNKEHEWKKTGVTRPGRFFGDDWPDVQIKCEKCGKTCWSLDY